MPRYVDIANFNPYSYGMEEKDLFKLSEWFHLIDRRRNLLDRLNEIDKILQNKPLIERIDETCAECRRGWIVNRREIHYIDGNHANHAHSNTAVVCPYCGAHILMSVATPKGIWEYKQKGMSNAQIGKLLCLSRERVRQLAAKYRPKKPQIIGEADIENKLNLYNIGNEVCIQKKELQTVGPS